MRGRVGGHSLWRAHSDNLPTTMAALWAQIHHPVGGFDDIQIMFDHHHGVAVIAQAMQHIQQRLNICLLYTSRCV